MLHIALLNKMDRAMCAQVLSYGGRDGYEHLRAYDLRSNWDCYSGGQSPVTVAIPADLQNRLRDPLAELYIHHNHPASVSFSPVDLAVALDVNNRARGKLYAHGHDGSTYGVTLANRETIASLYKKAEAGAAQHLRFLISMSHVPFQVAKAHFSHIVCQALDMAGVMHYEFAMSQTRIDDWQRCANYLNDVVAAATDAVGR